MPTPYIVVLALLMERVTGIEPAASAWEAEVLPLDYTRVSILYRKYGYLSRVQRNFFTILPKAFAYP